MHSSRRAVTSTAALASRTPLSTSSASALAAVATASKSSLAQSRRRHLHSSAPRFLVPNGASPRSNGAAKPPGDDDALADVEIESSPADTVEPIGGRSRHQASAGLKSRLARKRTQSALPEATLPPEFVANNVILFSPTEPTELPLALAEELKKTVLWHYDQPARHYETHGPYFEALYRALDVAQRASDKAGSVLENDLPFALQFQLLSQAVDRAACQVDILTHEIARTLADQHSATLTYTKGRPLWWYHLNKNVSRSNAGHVVHDVYPSLDGALGRDVLFQMNTGRTVPDALGDLGSESFFAVSDAIGAALRSSAPATFDAKTGKRPVTVLHTAGYRGKSISQSVARHVAHLNDADVVHLDAHELAQLVGGYLDQNVAYARGPLSMLGYRAAELSLVLPVDVEPGRVALDDENGMDTRTLLKDPADMFWEDQSLFKPKPSGLDAAGSKWDLLKMDNILRKIIRSVDMKREYDAENQPVLIHLHDFVELNMMLDGVSLVTRLRKVVDEAWQEGRKIAILATSSSLDPPEDYRQMIRELSMTDLVVSRTLSPSEWVKGRADEEELTIGQRDNIVENCRNIRNMMKAMDPGSEPLDLNFDEVFMAYFKTLKDNPEPPGGQMVLRQSVLPAPEVYLLASALRDKQRQMSIKPEQGLQPLFASVFFQSSISGPIRQSMDGRYLDEEDEIRKPWMEKKTSGPSATRTRREVPSLKLDNYEQRLAPGIVHKHDVKTTFADVHLEPEIIKAVNMLTSMAINRPEAFSYGILAQERISGCLLYGPPGTGKTLLARAVAHDSGATMLEVTGAVVNDKYFGEGEKTIAAIFSLAKKLSPCVVFIDEADSILGARDDFTGNRAAHHRELITQFLREWDGLRQTNAFVMVATNQPQVLDSAVLRRLPRKLLIDLPMQKDREAILRMMLKDEQLGHEVNLASLAERTPFYSGSDLKNVCVTAALAAVDEQMNLEPVKTILAGPGDASTSSSSNTTTPAVSSASSGGKGPNTATPDKDAVTGADGRRVLQKRHFEQALQQIPASISKKMGSLQAIKKFDEEYGSNRRQAGAGGFGFGIERPSKDVERDVKIRPGR